jgi:histidyl-tRNA synthetase
MMQTLKGFRDYIGCDARKRVWLVSLLRDVFTSYGFEPLETPALEYEALLLGKYGEEADKLIYGFEDHGGRRVALRYDQTVPTARVISQYRSSIPLPYKRYQIQPVWRAEKPQKGRYREFLQCDIDTIGTTSPFSDAEILAVVADVFSRLELPVTIKVNDRSSLLSTVAATGIEESQIPKVLQTIDKLDKKSTDEVVAELRERGVTKEQAKKIFESFAANTPSDSLKIIMTQACALGVPGYMLAYSPSLVRGLDYYTGIILEVVLKDAPGSLGGGGRYDNLVRDLVGYDVPAVGMAFGFDRILEALEEAGNLPETATRGARVLVASNDATVADFCAEVARRLRKSGIAVLSYPDPEKKLEAQIKYAVAKDITNLLIIAQKEKSTGTVTLKNLQTRVQEILPVDTVIRKLREA